MRSNSNHGAAHRGSGSLAWGALLLLLFASASSAGTFSANILVTDTAGNPRTVFTIEENVRFQATHDCSTPVGTPAYQWGGALTDTSAVVVKAATDFGPGTHGVTLSVTIGTEVETATASFTVVDFAVAPSPFTACPGTAERSYRRFGTSSGRTFVANDPLGRYDRWGLIGSDSTPSRECCADRYPSHPYCSGLEGAGYVYTSLSGAMKVWRDRGLNPDKIPGRTRDAEDCPHTGTHYIIAHWTRRWHGRSVPGDPIGSVLCCDCCVDTAAGACLQTRCKAREF